MKTDQFYKDLGFDVMKHDDNEFKPLADNVLNMPLKTYITMSDKHALSAHLYNLIVTFGEDKVVDSIIAILEGK